ncbi:MAG: phosphoribosylamine--glycine ligase [Candidatus Helarchaeota archaeon]
MVNVLLVGHGAREMVIGETLKKSGAKVHSFMASKNPGIARLANEFKLAKLNDFNALDEFIKNKSLDFGVIGPENPLADGIVDFLETRGIACCSPLKTVARIETSKEFCRTLLQKYQVQGNAQFRIFNSIEGLREYAEKLGELAVKPDGLTGGKGVKVTGEHLNDVGEIVAYAEEILAKNASVILEEKLDGEEYTLQAFVDGSHVIPTPLVQDHKRLNVDDTGPNTGGMGSYSCSDHLLPFVTRENVDESVQMMLKTVEALKKETGKSYKGMLYGQFMLTKKGPMIIEFNARYGDPEAMNILPLLETNFIEICEAMIKGNLHQIKIEFKQNATVTKYLVPNGYPINAQPTEVEINQAAIDKLGGKVYHASVHEEQGKIKTTKSRAIAVLGMGPNLEIAEQIAEKSIAYIKGNLFHRPDVGTRKILQKRMNHMNAILNS